jgi:hypothetical protein
MTLILTWIESLHQARYGTRGVPVAPPAIGSMRLRTNAIWSSSAPNP